MLARIKFREAATASRLPHRPTTPCALRSRIDKDPRIRSSIVYGTYQGIVRTFADFAVFASHLSPAGECPMRLLFSSIHSYLDPSSGAPLCTRELLKMLTARGIDCRVLRRGVLDYDGQRRARHDYSHGDEPCGAVA
jgi:hypothetical protein